MRVELLKTERQQPVPLSGGEPGRGMSWEINVNGIEIARDFTRHPLSERMEDIKPPFHLEQLHHKLSRALGIADDLTENTSPTP